jgi:hypothetical protein
MTHKNLSSNITKWLILPSNGGYGGILIGLNETKLEIIDY